MKKKLVIAGILALGAFFLFMTVGAYADNPTGVSATAALAPTLQLNMPTTAVDFGGGPLEAGQNYNQAITASINSNKAYRLAVTKDHDLQGPTESIPSASFTFGATLPAGGTYNAPAGTEFGTATRVVEGARGNNRSTTITYSLTVPWDQAPETYTATHTYTATQP